MFHYIIVIFENKFLPLHKFFGFFFVKNPLIIYFKQEIIMNFILLLTAVLTAFVLVFAAYWIAKLLSPRSYNPQKGEAYECGIPTRGKSWMQFRVGYYLFAVLFLIFDVETVFLFPWAVVVRDLGVDAIISVVFFFIVLVGGLAYAWKKGALEWK